MPWQALAPTAWFFDDMAVPDRVDHVVARTHVSGREHLPIRIRRVLTLLFAAAELTLLAGAPAVDALLHASTRADTAAQLATVAVPDWTCGYCLLQATPGVVAIPAMAIAGAVAGPTVVQSGLTDLLYSPPASAGHGARAPPIV